MSELETSDERSEDLNDERSEDLNDERSSIDWSSCAQWVHDLSGESLTTYPDDQWTVSDQESTTGLRLDLAGRAWSDQSSAFVQRLTEDLTQLDGWGINAGIVLKFDDDISSLLPDLEYEIPAGNDESSLHVYVYMENPAQEQLPHFPAKVPVEGRLFDEGRGLILEPLRPLRPATRYGVVVTAIPPSAPNKACLAPSDQRGELFSNVSTSALNGRRLELLSTTDIKIESIAAVSVFTTQSAPAISVDIANSIATGDYRWNDDINCKVEGQYQHCTRSFNASRFQNDEGVINGVTIHEEYPLKVHFWRPRNRADETPAILFGHGIGGDISNVYVLDEITEGLPITKIAIDAVSHGEHPTATSEGAFQRVLNFFALDLATQTLRALEARDNFRQSTYDKLQLVELLHQDPDMNDDGRPDLDLKKLGYYGLSLGGIMGVELLSLEPRFTLGLLAVPGARLVSVLTDGSVIGDFKAAIYALVGGKEVFDGITPLAQVLLDAADPGTYAPFVLGESHADLRAVREGEPLHLLMQMAMNDEVVPNSANHALARALHLPHLQAIAEETPLLNQVEGPLQANVANVSTAALFQFDRVTTGAREITASTHMNVPNGREGRYQSREFLKSWLDKDEIAPRIVDPYARYNVPNLP